jgi:hypothetical protein
METSALPQSASDRYPQAASPIHTILVLAVLGGWVFWHRISTDQLSVAANPNRVRFYLVTLLFEWLLFVLVLAGVRRSGASVLLVLGGHWHSARCCAILELPPGSGSLRGCSFGYWAGSCASPRWVAICSSCSRIEVSN